MIIIYLIFLIVKFNYTKNVATNITLLCSVGFLLFIACYKCIAATQRQTLHSSFFAEDFFGEVCSPGNLSQTPRQVRRTLQEGWQQAKEMFCKLTIYNVSPADGVVNIVICKYNFNVFPFLRNEQLFIVLPSCIPSGNRFP